MSKVAALSFVVALVLAPALPGRLFAQQQQGKSESDLLKQLDTINASGPSASAAVAAASPTSSKGADAKKTKTDDQEQKGPTEITATDETTYDEKTHKAVFSGNVVVKDPQFTISCNRLTAILKSNDTNGNGGTGAAKPSPTGKGSSGNTGNTGAAGSGGAGDGGGGGGGLDHAIAEGTRENPVVIVQDKPAADGGQPQHNVGRAERAEYNAATGEVKLIGWPQVSQGINLQKATSERTVMYMYRDEKRMRTDGPSVTIIQEHSQPGAADSSSKPAGATASQRQ